MVLSSMIWGLPLGILLLGLGGDMLVRGASGIARRLSVSRMLVGVTLVSFGTSMPELVTSLRAAMLESPGIAVGNVIGSNISNILLVLGTAAFIAPLAVTRLALMSNGLMVLIATGACIAVVMIGSLDRMIGLALVGLLLLYFVVSFVLDRHIVQQEADTHEHNGAEGAPPLHISLLLTLAGLACVLLGANWLVESSIELARDYNISETIIGLSVVAIGTSLPELITSIMATIRKESALAIGNILGSNIQNILAILGVTAIVHPIEVPSEIAAFDIWFMTAATILLLIFAATGRRVSRGEGAFLLLAYIGYVAYLAYLALGAFGAA